MSTCLTAVYLDKLVPQNLQKCSFHCDDRLSVSFNVTTIQPKLVYYKELVTSGASKLRSVSAFALSFAEH